MDDDILSNVHSMQLKDGTIIVVNQEEQAQEGIVGGEEQVQEGMAGFEEQAQEEITGVEEQDQSNQLRARPIMGRLGPVLPSPMPLARPAVVPLRPPLKPMVVPRGPVRRGYPAYPVPVFRGRHNQFLPKPVVHPKPKVYPHSHVAPGIVPPAMGKPRMMVTPAVVPGVTPYPPKTGMMAPQPVVKPLLNQMIQAPTVMPRTTAFRARPGQTDENDFQEEEYNGEEYEQAQDENAEVELRARPPLGVPLYRPVPMVPKVVPRPVVPMAPLLPRRGPIARGPIVGYNTFQPRVFRARPRTLIAPTPMFTPLNATFQPKSYGFGFGRPLSHHPGKRGYMPPPPMRVFRARPRSNSYDGQEYDDQNKCNTEPNECGASVCTRCGKEF